ncbi:MAG: ferrous iron transport protein B [Clostridia bacterium]
MTSVAHESRLHYSNAASRSKATKPELIVRLAGNPNVGKSTVFNSLTGLHQHTGNWAGKTVQNAQGSCRIRGKLIQLLDIPGAYSLLARSREEVVARDCICFYEADVTVIVCDATCLVRNLNLVLQTLEVTARVVVCVNLLDEAAKKKLTIDLSLLEKRLGVPVVGTSARTKKGLTQLGDRILSFQNGVPLSPAQVCYSPAIEQAIALLLPAVKPITTDKLNARWTALRLLEHDDALLASINAYIGHSLTDNPAIQSACAAAMALLADSSIAPETVGDAIVSDIYHTAESLLDGVIRQSENNRSTRQLKFDKLLTSKRFGVPVMLALLAGVFYLTIVGANVPSAWLSAMFTRLELFLLTWLTAQNAPPWLIGMLITGMFRTLAWVVAVMLPPMAIFFPLFTLLEDLGYLPRVAFNLDNRFRCCGGCGKQALTMCMGFGCNAAGVTGCRIIDSPRERLIAVLTNAFVPCNGRFPALIALITMGLVSVGTLASSLTAAVALTGVVLLGVLFTFAASKLLSKTLLRGIPSSFTLELPPFRKPMIFQVLVRSVFDRTLFVLGRAVMVAAPAGVLIWLMANVRVGNCTLLATLTRLLDPIAHPFGLDGVLLAAFLLGLPANEIVLPIVIMTYANAASLTQLGSLTDVRLLLMQNGWTPVTYICVTIFMLMHWPCSTTLITIKKETGSWRWTLVSMLLPTVFGLCTCLLVNQIWRLFA